MSAWFRHLGQPLQTAMTPEDALTRLNESAKINVVIIDGLNGLCLKLIDDIKLLRREEPLTLVTYSSKDELVVEMVAAGCRYSLTKPNDGAAIRKLLHMLQQPDA